MVFLNRKFISCCRIVLVAACAVFLTACSSIFFHPDRELRLTPRDLGLNYRDMWITSKHRTLVHAWDIPAKGIERGTLLFFHGNAENITTHIASVAWLPHEGVRVIALDYRGYGQSEGFPGLDGAIADINATITTVLESRKKSDPPLILLGQSLGGAMTVAALTERTDRSGIGAVVLESSFAGYREIVRDKLASMWLTWPFQWPLSFFFSNDRSPVDEIAGLSPLPVLIIHGTQDPIVPYHHGEELYEAAQSPKSFWTLEGGAHTAALNSRENRKKFLEYLGALPSGVYR